MNAVEFGGGLGDVFTLVWKTARYTSLEKAENQVHIILNTHNPHAKELFLFHKNKENLFIRDHGFWWPQDDDAFRRRYGLPPKQPIVFQDQDHVRFYPSDGDILWLKHAVDPYLAISFSAGGQERNIPKEIAQDILRSIEQAGVRSVALGRHYDIRTESGRVKRVEVKVKNRNSTTSLIDKLTVPGTLLAIEKSIGLVSSHSAMCLAAWYMKKPVFLLYPDSSRDTFLLPPHQYTFGRDREGTICASFSEYHRGLFEKFLSILKTSEESKNPASAWNR